MILLKECTHLGLIITLAMVRFLRLDVLHEGAVVGWRNRKHRIPTLPREIHYTLPLQPHRRGRFQLLHQLGDTLRRMQMDREVHMVGNAAHSKTIACEAASYRREIRMQFRSNALIQDRPTTLGAENNMNQNKAQRLGHSAEYRSRFQRSILLRLGSWGSTPGCYQGAPSALTTAAVLIILASFGIGCNSTLPATPAKPNTSPTTTYPPRPTTPPPPIKLFHQTDNSLTLVTIPNATDDQIAAILYQLHDAAASHTFDALGISQKFVDARDPMVWFHIYRGPQCASEKYTAGKLPCGASYHAAGDYTLGGFTDKNHDNAVLLHNEAQTELFTGDATK
jgi:hypothetical protein